MSSVENPTATQLAADAQLTPCSTAPTTAGAGHSWTRDHRPGDAVPVLDQRRRRVSVAVHTDKGPDRPAVGSADATDVEEAAAGAGRQGRLRTQGPARAVPSLDDRRVRPVRADVVSVMPTAMHCTDVAQLDPSRMSSPPVPCVGTTYQPPVAAPPGDAPSTVPAATTANVRRTRTRGAPPSGRRNA